MGMERERCRYARSLPNGNVSRQFQKLHSPLGMLAHTVALVLLKEPSALTASPRSTSLWYSAAAVAPIAGPIQKIHCAYAHTRADR